MTRKHYIVVAAAVAEITDKATRKRHEDWCVAVLGPLNANFDEARFRRACNVHEEK